MARTTLRAKPGAVEYIHPDCDQISIACAPCKVWGEQISAPSPYIICMAQRQTSGNRRASGECCSPASSSFSAAKDRGIGIFSSCRNTIREELTPLPISSAARLPISSPSCGPLDLSQVMMGEQRADSRCFAEYPENQGKHAHRSYYLASYTKPDE